MAKVQTEGLYWSACHGILLAHTFLFYFAYWLSNQIKSYVNKINQNQKDIEEVKQMIEQQKKSFDIDKRVSILEAIMKNKKGRYMLDPKVLFIIILIILFYLYLKSMGIVS